MNKKIIASAISAIILVIPIVVLAVPGPIPVPFPQFVTDTRDKILKILWFIAIGFIIVMFALAGFKYFTAQGDGSKISEANKAVTWGVIGTVIVVSAWSIIRLIGIDLGVGIL